MKYFLLALLIISYCNIQAQDEPKFRLGLQSGVNLSPAIQTSSEAIDGNSLLRVSFGFLVRQNLKRSFQFRWGGFKVKQHLFVDYGLNFVSKGYEYQALSQRPFTDQFAVEMPFLLVLKRGNNGPLYGWRRKNQHFYSKIGIKLSYTFTEDTFSAYGGNQLFKVEENTQIGGWNLLYHFGFGILKERKNGAQTSFGISTNLGFIETTNSRVSITQNGLVTDEVGINRKGSYFSLDLNYLFGKSQKIDPRKIYPKILCPHF